jgi:hypothetical protein
MKFQLSVYKDTWRAFCATHEVEAGGDDVHGLAAAGQLARYGNLEEVVRRVDAVLVQLELRAEVRDALLAIGQRDEPRLLAHAMTIIGTKTNCLPLK